jgi:competence protein ComEA
LDPNATPWRSLDSEAPVEDETPARSSPPLLAIAAGAGAVVLAVGAFLLAFGSGNGAFVVAGGVPLPAASGAVATAPVGGAELVVEIVGAVTRPGVYRLPHGSRIGELLTAAGGYSARVDVDRASSELNLAALLADGDQVRVPARGDAVARPSGGDGPPSAGGPGDPIELNTATTAQLEELPGIGPATAAKIIAAREAQPFTSVDELRSRGVLGEKTFEKVRPLVVVR